MALSEEELYNKLKPLESSMNLYLKNKLNGLSANEVDILRKTFDSVKAIAKTPMPVRLTTSCSTCIKQAFNAYITVYFELKDKFEPKPIKEEIKFVSTGQTKSGKKK